MTQGNLCRKHAMQAAKRERRRDVWSKVALVVGTLALFTLLCGGTIAAALRVRGEGPMPVCTGDVVTVVGDEPIGCDVVPPQRIDVVLPLDDASVEDCNDKGGRPVRTEDALICRGVDY